MHLGITNGQRNASLSIAESGTNEALAASAPRNWKLYFRPFWTKPATRKPESQFAMNIRQATQDYETWLASHVRVLKADLAAKHKLMAHDPFSFLRATFYRWMQLFPELCPELTKAPTVLSVGDLHVENYGTWRDAEGRLVWGINDFDEAFLLPSRLIWCDWPPALVWPSSSTTCRSTRDWPARLFWKATPPAWKVVEDRLCSPNAFVGCGRQ
jgi:hypothetical protein